MHQREIFEVKTLFEMAIIYLFNILNIFVESSAALLPYATYLSALTTTTNNKKGKVYCKSLKTSEEVK